MMNAPHSDATPADAAPRSGGADLRTQFRGTWIATGIPLAEYAGYLDERATFIGQWGLKPSRAVDGTTCKELVERSTDALVVHHPEAKYFST